MEDKNAASKRFEQQNTEGMFWRIATIENMQEFGGLTTAEEKDEYMAKVVVDYQENKKKSLEDMCNYWNTVSDTFDKYKATEKLRTESVIQNYLSMISIVTNCMDFTGGAPIPVEGCGVEITIHCEGEGNCIISILSGKDSVEKYGIKEYSFKDKRWYCIASRSLAMLMHDYCMVMHDPKKYCKEA